MKAVELKTALAIMDRVDGDNDYADANVDAYDVAARLAWNSMENIHREVLRQLLFTGPVWDGNIISKSARNDLMEWGLATRVCYMGEQGYAAATYRAFIIFREGGGTPIRAKPGERG